MVLCETGQKDASTPSHRSVTSLEDPQIHVAESGDGDSPMPGIRLLTKCKPISTPDCDDIAQLPLTPIRPVRQQPVFFTPVRQPKRRSFVGRFLTRIFNCTQPQKVKERFDEKGSPKKKRNSLVLNGLPDKRKGLKTSDDLDSIVSQDEFTIPPSHNATYFRAGVSPRPASSNPDHPVFGQSDAEQARHSSLPMTSSKPSIQSQPVFKDSEPKSLGNSGERPNHSFAVQSTSKFVHSDGKQLDEERNSLMSDRNPVQSPLPTQERPSTLSLPKSNGSVRSNGSPGTTPIAKAAQCKQDALKDATGMMEVHRMLSKFNAKRFNESKEKSEPGSGSEADSSGSIKTLRPPDSDTSFHTAQTSPESQNSPQKSGSSYASTSSSPKQGTPRKSLTAKYLEAKASEKKDTSLEIISESDASPQPVSVNSVLPDLRDLSDTSYFNHTLSFYNKDDSGSTTSEDSLEIINDPQEANLLAPIRQSLLHLVAEEDVPEILEAMAENLTFHIIQDTRMSATTSSCIQKQHRSKSESRRICFTEEPPQVFAYPDENFAMELGEWKEGRPITYNEYQNIVQTANEETQHQMNQLVRWRQQMQLKYAEQERALEDAVHQMNQAAINSVASTPSRTPTPTSAI